MMRKWMGVMGLAVSVLAAGASSQVELASMPGTISVVSTSLAAMTTGDVLYLGAAGAVTNSAPVASGTTVYRLGYVVNTSTNKIFFQPQFIGNNP